MSAFYRFGGFAINFDNIQYIERRKVQDESYLDIYFVGKDQPVMINENRPEGKALLYWWQNAVQKLPDGTE